MKYFVTKIYEVFPIGTKLYGMKDGNLTEFVVRSFSIHEDDLRENFISYNLRWEREQGNGIVSTFVQPIEGKFANSKTINLHENINTLYETKEECIKAYLESLGVRAEIKITID